VGDVLDETVFGSALEAADKLRRREVTARELVDAVFTQIEKVNPRVNAVVELRREAALDQARAADEALAVGERLGPLHGVPMTVKDSFNVAGMHTTWGDPAFKDFIADADATVVSRLRRAGAIILGKTNVHLMLGDFGQTVNELYGRTNNPWDLTRTPGGSTGGGAAALAAGMTFLEYGSDLVGSIRIPASFCGVHGLRPSAGIVPLTGFQPPGAPAATTEMTYMSAIGPLARSAADVRVALRLTAGPDDPTAKAYAWSLAPSRRERLGEFRVGVVLDHDRAPVSSEVGASLSNTVDVIARAGASVVEGWPEGVDPVQTYESFGVHVGAFFAFQDPGGEGQDLSGLVAHEHRRIAIREAWGRYFREVDVFVCPTNFTTPFPHDDRPFDERTVATSEGDLPYEDQAFWISHASLPGLPAMVAPIGSTPSGLPVGAQIIGPLYEDDTPISFAELLGDVVGGYRPPPL
jgi:amidase